LYLISVKNEYGQLMNLSRRLTSNFRVYYDVGHNFFDLSQALTISNEWYLLSEWTFNDGFITEITQDGARVVVLVKNDLTANLHLLDLTKKT
jgi:hypothetical protein